ncbi:MAG TPA: nucleoside 2-deoxyribosyltransferase [Candidatus Saccharimonadales bacterium]|nr:nucleoside 2-deoxyribosyltransferase [Candidatus Saccharimonadales bacterium]
MKKVYFACAITAGRDYAHHYPVIVQYIKNNGLHVLSEIFANQNITPDTGVSAQEDFTDAQIWEWDLDWIREADAIIAEVSLPSLGIGYEIATAHAWEKPVLALYHHRPEHKLSSMIAGSPNVTVFKYEDIAETEAAIAEFIATL